MKFVTLNISPLHADALATHLLIVLQQYVAGKSEGTIPEATMPVLQAMDQAYEKLNGLEAAADDETPQEITFTLPEAEAFIRAFTEPEFTEAAERDDYYRESSYAAYFAELYERYLEQVSEGYVAAMAA